MPPGSDPQHGSSEVPPGSEFLVGLSRDVAITRESANLICDVASLQECQCAAALPRVAGRSLGAASRFLNANQAPIYSSRWQASRLAAVEDVEEEIRRG